MCEEEMELGTVCLRLLLTARTCDRPSMMVFFCVFACRANLLHFMSRLPCMLGLLLNCYEWGGVQVPENHNFIKQALPALVPMLLPQLTKQEEGQDQDDTLWNLAMSAGTCLSLAAQATGNDIVPFVMPFVTVSSHLHAVHGVGSAIHRK